MTMRNAHAPGRLYGVGVGPGDPDLITVKAMKTLSHVSTIAYFCKRGKRSTARTIADCWLSPTVQEMALVYPLTTEIPFDDPEYVRQLRSFYEISTHDIAKRLDAGSDVAVLCEGDPMFYGSFMHLYVRLKERHPVTIIPGVSGMSGCWSAAAQPITWGDDIFTVLPATLPSDVLAAKLGSSDAFVVMKIGKNFAKVRKAIEAVGLMDRALYVERGTMPGERIIPLADFDEETIPYFSVILIPGQGRRP